MTPRLFGVALLLVALTSGTAAAQGRGNGAGNGNGNGRPRQPQPAAPNPTNPGSGTSQPAAPGGGLQPVSFFPQFGAWLDDASTPAGGSGYASIGVSYWQGAGASQIDVPVLGVALGVGNRAQVSATVPFYRSSYQGFTGSGLDNVYVGGKVSLMDPDAGAGRFGLAVGAVAEILSAGLLEGGRVHWAIPLSLEVRAAPVRIFGSSGYFSRGAFFAAGALEWTAPFGTSLTAAVSHSRSVRGVTVTWDVPSPRPELLDASLWIAHPVSRIASVYAAGGRTFSNTSIDGAASVSGGISFRFSSPQTVSPDRR